MFILKFKTMRLTIVTIFLFVFSVCYGKERNLPIDSISHIQIDSIVFYDEPYIISNAVHENNGFKPVWIRAYDAVSNPLAFERDAKKAMPYLHESIGKSELEVQNFFNKWIPKPDPKIDLTWYVLSEIFFTDKITQVHYIYVPAWGARYNLPVWLSQLDTTKLGGYHHSELDSSDIYYPFYRDDHGTYSFYIFEDSTYKNCDGLLMYNVLKWNMQANGGMFKSAKGIIALINRQKTYTRSRLVNGHRIFETVKNTPNGPVVVRENDGKAWSQQYWWAIAGGLAALALLAYFILIRRKK